MNILFLPKYGQKAASARTRFLQYYPYLEEAGIQCTTAPLFSDQYIEHRFATGKVALKEAAQALLSRVSAILTAKKYDLVVLNYEAFPYLPPLLERLLWQRKIPYVYDFDDAIFHNYDQSNNWLIRKGLSNKIAQIISHANMVLAGSPYLVDYAKQFSGRVEYMPQVMDLRDYPPPPEPQDDGRPVTIGWIGSPSTSEYVTMIADALRQFCSEHAAQVVLIGAGRYELPGVPLISREWSKQTEAADLQQFDVGIMPLTDTPWARGKCAFKLLQYMACGRPVVTSPVGMNVELVRESGAGLLASSQQEWVQALATLYADRALRIRMGQAGRNHIEDQYSLQRTGPRLAALLRQAASEPKLPLG